MRLNQIACKILLDLRPDAFWKLIDDAMIDFLLRSQPTPSLPTALNMFLVFLGVPPHRAAFFFDFEIVAAGVGPPPGRLIPPGAAPRRIRDPLVDIPLCFLQAYFLQRFEPRS